MFNLLFYFIYFNFYSPCYIYHFSTRRNYHCQPNILFKNNIRHLQGRRSRSDHPTLVGPKMLSFTVKALYFQSSGGTSNYQIEVLSKWSEQFCTPSDPPPLSYAGISFIHNHPQCTPGICTKNLKPPMAFAS